MQLGKTKSMPAKSMRESMLESEFKVVGIAASPGELMAVRAVLRALPRRSGCAFLLMVQSSSLIGSGLSDFLSDGTGMDVVEASAGTLIEPERLYIIPPGSFMVITSGRFRPAPLQDRRRSTSPYVLLHSLAQDYGPQTVAVILSEIATAGLDTVRAVREAGGLVLVRGGQAAQAEGDRAKAALATDHENAPFVRALAEAVLGYHPPSEQRIIPNAVPAGMALMRMIIEAVKGEGQAALESYDHRALHLSVEARLKMLGIAEDEVERYAHIVRESSGERRHLEGALRAAVRRFFRDEELFASLRATIIPDIVHAKMPGDAVRVWVAGCGTGEEAYTLAILLLERIKADGRGVDLRIFASDTDLHAVAEAIDGRYPPSALEAMPPDLHQAYFQSRDGTYRVSDEVRNSVVFLVQDPSGEPPLGRIDLAFASDLRGHLWPGTDAEAVSRFSSTVTAGGILVMGRSEATKPIDDAFEPIPGLERAYRFRGVKKSGAATSDDDAAGRGRITMLSWDGNDIDPKHKGLGGAGLRLKTNGEEAQREGGLEAGKGETHGSGELQSLNRELEILNGQLHEALERQRAISSDLQNVLHSAGVPLLLLDKLLNIRFFTPSTRSLFDIMHTDVGRPFTDLSALTDDTDLSADALAVLATGNTISKEVAGRNGQWFLRRIKPYRTEQDSVEGVVVTFIDISDQKQIMKEREAAKRSAELATEAKSHFLAAASHDLRQPLQTLKLLQGLLDKTVTDAQSRMFVKRMGVTLASMSGILNTVLDINQIDAGIVHPKPESFAVADILDRLGQEFLYPARAKGLDLRIVTSKLPIFTDPRLLEQIIRNLLSNGLKYTSRGKVLVGCRRRGAKLRLEVWDTGIGIPADQIDEIFDEYRQLDVPAGNREQGLGLGLSIVKRLSDLLDLKVSVRSKSHQGSVFAIEIPRAIAGHPVVNLPPPGDGDARPQSRSASILLIEDEHGLRDLLKIGLEQAGYMVAAASEAGDAEKIIRDGKFAPDIILADHNLSPGVDGLTAIVNIRRALARPIPALILTGDISSKALRKYGRNEIPHLNKPVKLDELVSAIDELLGHSSSSARLDKSSDDKHEVLASRMIEIIDDEEGVRDNIEALFNAEGWSVMKYGSAEEYLGGYDPERVSCLLIDAYLPGMGGLELLRTLKERQHGSPMIIITGHSDVHMAVEAMKNGAVDFIEKPFSVEEIYLSARRALALSRDTFERFERRRSAETVLAGLTRRQREILDRIVLGQPNKIIAAEMGLSQRTVENHRASIMRRTGSTSLPALLRLVAAAEE